MKPEVSIIIVYYKVKKELFACLKSVKNSKSKTPYEVIVVDNDEKKEIEQELKEKFPWVLYKKSNKNIGYSAGNNLGASFGKGEYFFFLNPDTLFEKRTIDILYSFLKKNGKAGIVAPLLLDKNKNPYKFQGTQELNPANALFALSFLNKIFSRNAISRRYWFMNWDKKDVKEVHVVPGTAFVIKRDIFEKVGRFDERFFLYFEESDLCKRVRNFGYKIYILPQAKAIHLWGKSTSHIQNADSIFLKSRFYYFKKHFGLFSAFLVHMFLSINKRFLILSLILVTAAMLRFYKLNELMPFIHDQGWFYLSARDMLLKGEIPLIGPPTSHPWIHHGPLWTYTLAIILLLFNFNPIPPAYFIAVLGVITVWLLYKVGSLLFSRKTGFIAALLYATSPLIVLNARIPYHTSPIPFFVILLMYSVYKWLTKSVYYFPFITFLMGVLYNHELTTFVLFIPVFLLLGYGFWKKQKWLRGLLNTKLISFSILTFLIPMIPFIVYDIAHEFKQTAGFLVWVLYRIAKLPLSLIAPSESSFQVPDLIVSAAHFFSIEFFTYLKQLIFSQSFFITILLFFLSLAFLFYTFATKIKNNEKDIAHILLVLYSVIPILGLFLHRVPIEADTLLVSPIIILILSIFFDKITNIGFLKLPVIVFIIAICLVNIDFLSKEYFTGDNAKKRLTVVQKLRAVDSAVKVIHGRDYNLIGKGDLSFFPAFTMPYEYLLWWKGYPPKKQKTDVQITIEEKNGNITVYEEK